MNVAESLALVEPFASADEARTTMHTPFYAPLYGRPYVCATDGHTAAIVACADASASTVVRPATADRPPPIAAVIPDGAERIGHLLVSELEALRTFPARWNCFVHFVPGEAPRLTASYVKKRGKKCETIKIVTGAALAFANTLEAETAMTVGYLLRAVDFCGVERVTVWREGGKKAELNPLLFTSGSLEYTEAPRLTIVMPVRP